MAILGIQLVVTMVMASFLSKIIPRYSLAKYLLCKTGLRCYLYPTDEELRDAAGIVKKAKGGSSSKKKKGVVQEEDSTFTFPRNISVHLTSVPVTEDSIIGLQYYAEFQWLVDFSFCSLIVYVISEVYIGFFMDEPEVNLSMVWCLLTIGFSLKLIASLTNLYFQGEDSDGEKAMLILSFFTYLLIALGILIISEERLDLGLDLAYSSFNQSAAIFLKAQGLPSDGAASQLSFKITLAALCAWIGTYFTFPGIRLGRMHVDSLRMYKDEKLLTALYHLSFVAPVFLTMLWIRPLSRRYFTESIIPGYSKPLMTSELFEILRIVLVMLVAIIRLALMPKYLQSYLNLALESAALQKIQAGRISNKEYQKKIYMVFQYFCVVALQYIIPLIICTFLALMGKTLGGLEWGSLLNGGRVLENVDANVPTSESIQLAYNSDTILETSKLITIGVGEIRKVFSTQFYRGVFSFVTLWCIFSWFLSGTFGVLLQTYYFTYRL